MDSSKYMTCSLKVDTQSAGWHKSLEKIFKSIHGISYSIDAQKGIVLISGNVDPYKILGHLAKAGKHAELCRIDSGYQNRDLPIVPGKGYDYGYNPPYATLDYYRDNPPYGTLDYYQDSKGYDYGYNPPYGTLDYYRDNPPYGTLDYYRDNPQQRYRNPRQQHHQQYHEPPAQYLPQLPPPPPPPRYTNVGETQCNIM